MVDDVPYFPRQAKSKHELVEYYCSIASLQCYGFFAHFEVVEVVVRNVKSAYLNALAPVDYIKLPEPVIPAAAFSGLQYCNLHSFSFFCSSSLHKNT
jgi:hypothetical protein